MRGRNVSRRAAVVMLGGGVLVAPAVLKSLGEEGDVLAAAKLLAPFEADAKIGRWTIAKIGALSEGAARVDLRDEKGVAIALEIMAKGTGPLAARAPGETKRYAVHVVNGGDGHKPTDEEAGLAAMALAGVIAKNEASVNGRGFLTLAERLASAV